jgi:cation diffusion facilitator family transporter
MGISHDDRMRAGRISLAVGLLVLATKVSAYLLTGSAAIFSDASESVVNVAAAALLIWSLAVAARPADRDHPYGHGKVEFFTAGIEGGLIGVAAVMIAIHAGRELVVGVAPQQLDLGMLLLVGGGGLNAALGIYLMRVGRKTGSLALVADARHVLADVWTSVGVLAGLAAVWFTGWTIIDPLIALAVAVWILREAVGLARRAVEGLMDAADEPLLDLLAASLERERPPEWIDVHGMRAWRSGAELHVDLHMVVPRYWNADGLHAIHETIAARLVAVEHGAGDAVVHFDPCRPRHCAGCTMADCPVRDQPCTTRRAITRTRATHTLDG